MHRINAPIAELAKFFEKGGAFDEAWRCRPGLHLFPRAYLLSAGGSTFEANVSDGKRHVLVKGQALDGQSSALTFDVRGKMLGWSVGCLTIPLLGLGFFVLLSLAIKARNAKLFAEREILPLVLDRYPQARPVAMDSSGAPGS